MKNWIKHKVPGAARGVRWMYHQLNVYRSKPRYYLSRAPFLEKYDFDLLYFDGRGNHPQQHLDRTKRYVRLGNADVLVVGCRYGNELELWLKEKPKSLVAFDYFAFPQDWAKMRSAFPNIPLEFFSADAHFLPLADSSFDLVVSDNVLEHLSDPARAIQEMHRILRPGGMMFAGFVPLFWTFGGAHYSGAFEHLLYPPEKFYKWIAERNLPVEQSECRHYLDHNMFSYWNIDQYLHAFRLFKKEFITLHLSKLAYQYRATHPREWSTLLEGYAEKDLLISGATVWLRKIGTDK